MSRPRQLTLSALNITVHPHTRDGSTYVDLMKTAFAMEKGLKLRGTTYAMIGTMTEVVTGRPEDGLEGDLFQFTQIDFDSDWLNTKTNKAVSPDDVKTEIELPDYLKPNLKRSRYVFYPKSHRLVFASENQRVKFSPLDAEKFFTDLFSDTRITRQFKNIEVSIEQSKEALDAILNEMQLEQLIIVVKKPNPDGDSDDDTTIEQVLDEQKAKRQTVELVSENKQFLVPNKANRDLANLATSGGNVFAKGLDSSGKKVKKDTKNHPIKQKYSFFPENQEFRGMFLDSSEDVIKRIKRK